MYFYGLALVLLNLTGLTIGYERVQAPLEDIEGSLLDLRPEALIKRWPEYRLRRYLELRARYDKFRSTFDRDIESEVLSLLYVPIRPSYPIPLGQCKSLTIDQLTYWVIHFSGRQDDSRWKALYSDPPSRAQTAQKRKLAVELCETAFDERVSKFVEDVPDCDVSGGGYRRYLEGYKEARHLFSYELATAEDVPHLFEPDFSSALYPAAKHSIHDLRDLLKMFGVQPNEEDTNERLTELAKAHTALWVGWRL
ncbi:cytochrome P450 family protein [Ceratobasidium sp. AG-Ba]|nr:cytochrome P450 family protein [Ceratobasidium sp. AG-Ba]